MHQFLQRGHAPVAFFVIIILCNLMMGFSLESRAAGPKPPGNTGPGLRTPTPKRAVVWKGAQSPRFRLPNGQDFTISPELSQHLGSLLIQSGDYQVITEAPPQTDPCEETLEVRANLANFELEATQFKIRFGYTPSGNIFGGISQIGTKVDIALNSAVMDVMISKCKQGLCKGLAAGVGRVNPANINTQFQVDFSQFVLGIDFFYKTPISKWLGDVFQAALADIKSRDQKNDLPWKAEVIAVHPTQGGVTMNAGTENGIQMGDLFYVLREVASNACNSYLPIAQAQVKGQLTPVSAYLEWIELQSNEVNPVQVGDVLMIKRVTGATPPGGASRP